jgi:GT2 family glycosyltransferase
MSEAIVPDGWRVELVIVDNGSRDDTRAVVNAARLRNMTVSYVFEPTPGKGYACNAGLTAARGAVLLLTDDDTRVPRDWIEQMCRPLLDGHADAVQGGVTIAPHLERRWLKGVLRTWIAEVCDPQFRPEGLVGANMAFTRRAVAQVGMFDTDLGPGAAGFYEDTLFGWSLERAGLGILYRPSVAVEHHFDADRLSLQAFLSTARRMAASRAIVSTRIGTMAARPGWSALLRQLPALLFRAATQIGRYAAAKQPDPGFLYYYYQLHLWRALRARAS